MTDGRVTTTSGRLVRLGFEDVERASRTLDRLGAGADVLTHLVGTTADPDQALEYLADLADRVPDRDALLRALVDDEGTAMRLFAVLGASSALGDHLLRHPEHWRDLCDPALGSTRPRGVRGADSLLRAVGADPQVAAPVSHGDDATCVDALRVEYRRLLLRLAARDLSHAVGVDDVAAELSDLAAGTLDAALAIARARVGDTAASARLAVIAMGKCGGHELNYVSDVDVIFVAEAAEGYDESGALRAATQLASNLMRICSDHTGEGTIWPVDANLRPEGKTGPLVRTLASHEGYYQKWAKTWEFQALLKARPVAGDLEVGRRVLRPGRADGLVGVRAGRFRDRRAGHAPARHRAHPGRSRRAADQARLRRPARRRVRGPAAPARARAFGRVGARFHDLVGAGAADPGRVRRTRGRRGPRCGVPLPAHPRAPHAAVAAASHPCPAGGRRGAAPAGALDGFHA